MKNKKSRRKGWAAIFMALILLSASGAAESRRLVTLYAPDGRIATVYEEEAEAYKNLGWYGTYNEVVTTLYAPDGRTITVYKAEEEAYKNLGWYGTYDEVVTMLYAPDGRTINVYKDEADTYKALGWYDARADVVVTLYDRKGNTIEVYKAERATYLALGWYDSPGIDPNRPMIALTYDDGPSRYTSSILDTLTKYDAAATFFIVGNNAAAYPSTVAREAKAGMELGNHTYDHPTLTKLSAAQVSSQISRTDSAVSKAAGKGTTLLRPPYGSYNQTTRNAAGKPIILWSVDTRDWESRNADKVYSHVMNNVKDGDIVLMHDLYASTASATARIVPALIERGFQLVTVSDLARYKGVTLQNGSTYSAIR